MDATLTIRLSGEQREQVRKLAVKLGKTDSELVRELIERGLAAESVGRRLAHLKGGLAESPSPDDAMSRTIRERNWRS
jgi:predicted transcriptional regulator